MRRDGAEPARNRADPTRPDRFRPDLEGLRAVAVGLVLLYHARVPGFQGGYIGVDVFFVLSGFLITGLLLRELETSGRVDLPAFYARRARRLLPAAALVIGATVLVSVIVLPPLRVPDIAADGAAAAVYASNLRFALLATDYLGSELAPSPLLHTWSLGVEEQLYLVWPALLAAAAGGAARGAVRARRIGLLVGCTLAGGFAVSLVLLEVAAPWAFFSLPSRAWELALGAALVLPMAHRLLPGSRGATAMGIVGVAAIVGAGMVFDAATAVPGIPALVPALGAALVVAAGRSASPAASPVHVRLLSVAPMRFIGRISYSLYLWHWPLLVLPAAAGDLPGPARLALLAVAVVLAAATHRWVEEPFRNGRYVGRRPAPNLALAGAVSIAIAVTSLGAGAQAAASVPLGPVVGGTLDSVPLPDLATASLAPSSPAQGSTPSSAPSGPPFPTSTPTQTPVRTSFPATPPGPVPADLAPGLFAARDDLPPIYSDGCHLGIPETRSGPCRYGAPDGLVTVALFGDSHAAQWFPALDAIARARGWELESLTKSGCPSVDVPVWSASLRRAYTECAAWRDEALARLAADTPLLVVVANSRDHAVLDGTVRLEDGAARDAAWSGGLRATIERLQAAGSSVIVLGDTPRAATDPPVCLSARLDDVLACATPAARALDPAHLGLEAAVAAATGARFIDPTPWTCPTDPCPVVVGRFLVYRDEHHLTATYARALAERLAAALVGVPTGSPTAP